MKIAILTPHPIPFALGGAENLWWGLQDHIENETPHSCDIVALPSAETNLKGLMEAYEAFFRLDLSDYDCVISGKYPAWMAGHPNHVCYMLHRLRGLYDTYGGPNEIAGLAQSPDLRIFTRWMDGAQSQVNTDRHVVEELFDRFNILKDTDLPEGALALPGPLARKIIHFLDNASLSPERINTYAAISATVANRSGYFSPGTPVEILHPPPHRDDYRCGGDDYLFVSSRLDGAKRVALLIEAMRHVKDDIPLLIAGTGPEEQRLHEMAEADPRIRFLGFVPDNDMPELYANALAVPFVPHDEDYGLVTIEAMRSGKPVLTCVDSGGPPELVLDGVNGFIASPDPKALAARIAHLCTHRDEARAMGAEGRRSVERISWKTIFDGLQTPAFPSPANGPARRTKLTVATTFPVWPPMGGGQARVFHLYRSLADSFDIDIVSLNSEPGTQGEKEIAPGLMEFRVSKTLSHLAYERDLFLSSGERPVDDIAAHLLTELTPDFLDTLEMSAMTSDALIACHPYLATQIKAAAPGKPLWYEAQDVECELKQSLLGTSSGGEKLVEAVRKVERLCWRSSQHVFACADRDLKALASHYGPTRAHLHEVPNGVALDEIRFVSPQQRKTLRAKAGLTGRSLAFFMGSWHGPNLEAIEEILLASPQLPGIDFVIIGSACSPFAGRRLPPNVSLLGQVTAETRDALLATADVALNPMCSGSGTNLKMLDYFAAGVPVISSRFGARGLMVEDGRHFMLAEPGLAESLASFFRKDKDAVGAIAIEARSLVEEHYSWQIIADNFAAALAGTGFGSKWPLSRRERR